jgi:hypothetical protein
MISAAHLSSHRLPAPARSRDVRQRGRWAAAGFSLLLAVLAPALALAAELGYRLPRIGAIPFAGGWIGAGVCALLAVVLALRALAALPPRPSGGAIWRLASFSLTLGGLGLLGWAGLSLYGAYFLLFIPTLLVAVG